MDNITLTVRNLELTSYFLLAMEDQRQILEWRNHPSVRNLCFQTDIINEDAHFGFIKSLETDETKRYWMVTHKNEKIGSLDLYHITDQSCYWGYYLAPDRQKSALGLLLEFVVLEIVFERMHLRNLLCETLNHNTSVLNIHRQFGFTETIRKNGNVFMEITQATWRKNKHELENFIEILLR